MQSQTARRMALEARPEERVASLHAEDFFGEMALLTDEPRNATVTAATDCRLVELSRKDVDALCQVCDGVRQALEQAARERAADSRRGSWV